MMSRTTRAPKTSPNSSYNFEFLSQRSMVREIPSTEIEMAPMRVERPVYSNRPQTEITENINFTSSQVLESNQRANIISVEASSQPTTPSCYILGYVDSKTSVLTRIYNSMVIAIMHAMLGLLIVSYDPENTGSISLLTGGILLLYPLRSLLRFLEVLMIHFFVPLKNISIWDSILWYFIQIVISFSLFIFSYSNTHKQICSYINLISLSTLIILFLVKSFTIQRCYKNENMTTRDKINTQNWFDLVNRFIQFLVVSVVSSKLFNIISSWEIILIPLTSLFCTTILGVIILSIFLITVAKKRILGCKLFSSVIPLTFGVAFTTLSSTFLKDGSFREVLFISVILNLMYMMIISSYLLTNGIK